MTTNWPAYYPPPGYPPPRPRPPGSVRASLVLAIIAATLLGLIAGGLLLFTAAFYDDNGNGGDAATAGLLIVVPNALLATLLAVGATRLHGGHSSGRSLLTSAAVLDLAAGAAWAILLGVRHSHDLTLFLRFTCPLLLPPVIAAAFAWTSSARRWTHRPSAIPGADL
jgi:hypothetical protein